MTGPDTSNTRADRRRALLRQRVREAAGGIVKKPEKVIAEDRRSPVRGLAWKKFQAKLWDGVKRMPRVLEQYLAEHQAPPSPARRAFLVGGLAVAALTVSERPADAATALFRQLATVTGDVLSVEVLSDEIQLEGVIRPEGAIIKTVIRGLSTGLTHDFSKWHPAMSMPGYANTPTLSTDDAPPIVYTAITLSVVGQCRKTGKAFSVNHASTGTPVNYIEYVNANGDLEVFHVLNQEVPAGVAFTCTLDAGAVTGSNASKAGLCQVVNRSQKAHRRPHAQFMTLPHTLVQGGTTMPVEIACFHAWAQQKSEVACVRVRARSAVTGGTVGPWLTINTMSQSTLHTYSGLCCQYFRGNVDLTGLPRQVCYLEFVAFAWWGTRVYDSNNVLGGGADGTALDATTTQLANTAALRRQNHNCPAVLDFFNDTTSTYGQSFARVNASTGNDTTGAVYASEAAAIAGNAYATWDKAYGAFPAYNNTNFGRSDPGNSVIIMDDGTHLMCGLASPVSVAQNVGAVWCYTRKRTASSLGAAIFSANNAGTVIAQNQRTLGRRCVVQGMAFAGVDNTVANTNTWFYGGDFGSLSELVIDGCTMTKTAGTTSGSTTQSWHYGVHLIWVINSDITSVTSAGGGVASGSQGIVYAGNKLQTFATAPGCHYFIGNQCTDAGGTLDNVRIINSSYVRLQADVDVWIGAFNDFKTTTAAGSGTVITVTLNAPLFNNTSGQRNPVSGLVWVCNQIDTADSSAAPAKAIELAADGTTSTCPDYVIHCNTHVGERTNAFYNENSGNPAYPKSPVLRYNYFDSFNMKRDTNDAGGQTKEELRTGSYLAGFGVNGDGNWTNGTANNKTPAPLSWLGDRFPGTYGLGTLTPNVVSNTSLTGTPSSTRGDYRPQTGSSLLGLRPAGMSPLPFDLFGGAVNDNAAGPAGARIAA